MIEDNDKINCCYLTFLCLNYEECIYREPAGILPCKYLSEHEHSDDECWNDKAKQAILLRILFPDLQCE